MSQGANNQTLHQDNVEVCCEDHGFAPPGCAPLRLDALDFFSRYNQSCEEVLRKKVAKLYCQHRPPTTPDNWRIRGGDHGWTIKVAKVGAGGAFREEIEDLEVPQGSNPCVP